MSLDYSKCGFVFLALLMIVAILVYQNPRDPDKWCEVRMPMANISSQDHHVAYCYGEGWSKYCKISYPNSCPVRKQE